MEVTVVIPTFNNGKFIENGLNSCLIQPQVVEIILVDDGSTDNTVEICKNLAENNPKIRLTRHPNGENLGAGATRNRGIKEANSEYIAFLDADDFYLENRFGPDEMFFKENPSADGVYNGIGAHAYDEVGEKWHSQRMKDIAIEGLDAGMTTMVERIPPKKLLRALVFGDKGWFHFNGLTLARSAFDKAGYLDPKMWYGQDSEFFLRLAIHCEIHSGQIDSPVAMRVVYEGNSTLSIYTDNQRLQKNHFYRSRMWKIMFRTMLNSKFEKDINKKILSHRINFFSVKFMNRKVGFTRKLVKLFNLSYLYLRHPKLIFKVL